MRFLFHRVCAVVFAAAAAASPARGQTPEPPYNEGGPGIWYAFGANAALGRGWGAGLDLQYRNHTFTGDLEQFLVVGIGRYTLPRDEATVALAYGVFHSEAQGEPDQPTIERRLYEEVRLQQRVLAVRLGHRFRYEQRWVGGQDPQTRFRYALSGSVPLTSRDPGPGDVFAAASTEVFLRGAGRGDRPVFDRSRLFGGLGLHLSSRLRLQAGYLHQTFVGAADGQIQVALQTSLTR